MEIGALSLRLKDFWCWSLLRFFKFWHKNQGVNLIEQGRKQKFFEDVVLNFFCMNGKI